MLWQLSTNDWVVSLAFISSMSYIIGWFCDHILGATGFGHIGNWLLILLGAYSGMYALNMYGYQLTWYPHYTLAAVLCGSLVTLISMCLIKRFVY